MKKNTISVVIPCFNEQNYIEETINDILNKTNVDEIIFVDDASTDRSVEIVQNIKNTKIKIIKNSKNLGKGESLKNGFSHVTSDIIVIQDADNEYDPIEFKKFIKIYEKFDADLIVSTRMNYDEYRSAGNFFNKIGNHIITNTFNILFNTSFTDIYSCYISIKRELLDPNQLKTNGFQQQAEILTKVIKKTKRKYEVSINYNGRSKEEGKKIKFYHIFAVLYEIIKGFF